VILYDDVVTSYLLQNLTHIRREDDVVTIRVSPKSLISIPHLLFPLINQIDCSKKTNTQTKMKFAAALLALVGSAAAFAPSSTSSIKSSALKASFINELPGALAPTGLFDPLNLSDTDEATLKRYREAEVTHSRVAMLAVVGVLVGEKVEGSSFLFDSKITGPAISHLAQVPPAFFIALTLAIGAAELKRATIGYVEPNKQIFTLREGYAPGDIGFDPLGLKSKFDIKTIQTKELQNGRLAMLAIAGFVAQELVDGKGILEHFGF
jgi:hypothetical protein